MSIIQILYTYIYIYLYTRWMYYLSCVKPNLYTASTCNKCVSNQPKTETEYLNKCENSLKIVLFASFQNCAPK